MQFYCNDHPGPTLWVSPVGGSSHPSPEETAELARQNLGGRNVSCAVCTQSFAGQLWLLA